MKKHHYVSIFFFLYFKDQVELEIPDSSGMMLINFAPEIIVLCYSVNLVSKISLHALNLPSFQKVP